MRIKKQEGIGSFLIIATIALFAVAIPVTTNLVKQNQENRSQATALLTLGQACRSDSECITKRCGGKTKTCVDGVVDHRQCTGLLSETLDDEGNLLSSVWCGALCNLGICNNQLLTRDSRCTGKSNIGYCFGTTYVECDGKGNRMYEEANHAGCSNGGVSTESTNLKLDQNCRSDSECITKRCGTKTKTCVDGVVDRRSCNGMFISDTFDDEDNLLSSVWCGMTCDLGICRNQLLTRDSRCTGKSNIGYCFGTTYVECDGKGNRMYEEANHAGCSNGGTDHDDLCTSTKIGGSCRSNCLATEVEKTNVKGCEGQLNKCCINKSVVNCGEAHNKSFSSLLRPTKNLCSAGKIPKWTDAVGKDGRWDWECGVNKCWAFVDDCEGNGGTCKTVCANNEYVLSKGNSTSICKPSLCCKTKEAEMCNPVYNGKNILTRPSDDKACILGTVYWLDVSAKSGSFLWRCEDGEKKQSCSAKLKVNGKCGTTRNTCIKGGFVDLEDSNFFVRWKCIGKNGGVSVNCTVRQNNGYFE